MKKYAIIFFIISGLAFGIYLISGQLSATPPSPIVKADGKKIETARGSYCWETKWNAVCADSVAPPEIIAHDQMLPVAVAPEAKITIAFKDKPTESGVNVWTTEKDATTVPLINEAFIAPKEQGIYIYDVYAHWEKGSASYAFVIKVK